MKNVQVHTWNRVVSLAAILAIALASCNPVRTTTTIDFEDLTPGTTVRTQYGSRGVVFTYGYLDTDDHAHSGTQVLRAGNPSGEFHPGPLVMQFSTPQEHVRLYAGLTYDQKQTGILRAYDTNDSLIGQDGPKDVPPNTVSTPFEISASASVIVKLELEVGIAEFEVIDDLEFESQLPASTSIPSPVVRITNPQNGASLDVDALTVTGTVSGEGLMPSPRLTFTYRSPTSQTSTNSTLLSLSGSGTARNFEVATRTLFNKLPIGPISIAIEVENITGGKGIANIAINNMPALIESRLASLGSAVLGQFSYGLIQDHCTIAVYERGAISLSETTTRIITGEIFSKWLALKIILGTPFQSDGSDRPGKIGCPLEEIRQVGSYAVQDFEYGRIVLNPDGAAYYVPRVFAEAIDISGGMTLIGFPTADPIHDIRPTYETWLFQRFIVSGAGRGAATLEIRGTPEKLYIEWIPAVGAATIVDVYNCSKQTWTCNFLTASRAPVADMGQYCNYEAYNWEAVKGAILSGSDQLSNSNPNQWESIEGDLVQTPLRGTITASHLTNGDNPFTHQHELNCSLPAVLDWIGSHALSMEEPPTCAADWDLDVAPLPAWRYVLGQGRDTVRIEYEKWYFDRQPGMHLFPVPKVGDLIFASGRWVVDCGHDYKTEIHPPGILSWMTSGNVSGRAQTLANVWVTGWFTGGTVEFIIDPPPRPSPTALLGYLEEIYDAPYGVQVTVHEQSNRLVVRISSSAKSVQVTGQKEMIWEPGTGFLARYYVYWSEP